MAGGPMKMWNEWATQILVLLSFALQIFLFLFARTRRHGPSAMLKILLWLAYLMADSIAVYNLGHLSINGSLRGHELVVFWAPFLLLHLGSQDTITAYALEENKLWPRHLLNLAVQAFGVAYVLYKHIVKIPTLLGLATGLMFVVGLIKYGGRICALKSATLDSIRSSIRKPQLLPKYYSALPCRGRQLECDEEELLLYAHDILPLCKGAMVDSPVALFIYEFPVDMSRFYMLNWNWEAIYKMVEMEMSLMYDIIYTKAAMIHTWYGYMFHLVSPLAIVDTASVFSTLGSTWTCSFLWTRGWSKLGNVILSLRRLVKAAAGNRGWSGSIGQFNLLHFCSRDKSKLSSRVAKMMGLEDWWNKIHYSETIVISKYAKELVFEHVWRAVQASHAPGAASGDDAYMEGRMVTMPPGEVYKVGFRPEPYEDTARRRMKLAEALSLGGELEEAILTWHLSTDLFLLCSGITKCGDAVPFRYLEAIKALSNYLVFLIAIRPEMIPGLELRSLYEAASDYLDTVWRFRCHKDYPSNTRFTRKEEMFAHVLQTGGDNIIFEKQSVILRNGILYANLLLQLLSINKPDKSGIISNYELDDGAAMDKLKLLMPDLELTCRDGVFDMPKVLALIFDSWVRLLILTSARCSRDTHARQINCGGELMTVIWLMEEHAAVFLKPFGYKELTN